jgi:hypothetical protein
MPEQTVICTCDISIPIPAISASFTLEPKGYSLATYEKSSTTRANVHSPNEIAVDDLPLSVSKIRSHPHQSAYNLVGPSVLISSTCPPMQGIAVGARPAKSQINIDGEARQAANKQVDRRAAFSMRNTLLALPKEGRGRANQLAGGRFQRTPFGYPRTVIRQVRDMTHDAPVGPTVTTRFAIPEVRRLFWPRRASATGVVGGGAPARHAPVRWRQGRCRRRVVEDQSNKLANTVDTNQRLRLVYSPVNVASVRRFDEARAIGVKLLLEQNGAKSMPISSSGILLGSRTPAKPLK